MTKELIAGTPLEYKENPKGVCCDSALEQR
jgi:hypothetical protein